MNLIGTKELETERLILRKVRATDAEEAYASWCSDDRVSRYVLWETHENEDITKNLYTAWENEYEDPEIFRWMVVLKETGELMGTIDVPNKKFLRFGTVEIGYCYGQKFWGNGYATEALGAVMKYLFMEVEVDVIFIQHLSNNPASGKVMIKNGLKFEGIERGRIVDKLGIRNDIYTYSLLREEYLKEHNFE